jgi:hypothetical protein
VSIWTKHNPRSVIDLACVNSFFLSICAPFLVRTLKFYVYNDGEHLKEDILHYSKLLQRADAFSKVRRLIIVSSEHEEVISEYMDQRRSQKQWQRPRLSIVEYGGLENDILQKYTRLPGSKLYKDTTHQKNHLWAPLAEFVARLPRLQSIFYSCYYQFPPCLFDSINQRQSLSQCGLYITRFALWSLEPRGTTDPYEYALLTSPFLHGIGTASLGVYGYTLGRNPDHEHVYLTQALRDLVSDLTPQLKNMFMIGIRMLGAPAMRHNPPPWIGFTPQPKNQRAAALEALEIRDSAVHYRFHTRTYMEKWRQDIDFSVLKTLRLNTKLQLDAVDYLAADCRFPSLSELSINFVPSRNRGQPPNYYSTASVFLVNNIPSLSTLEIRGWHPELTTDSILKHHGPRLQKLVLSPVLGETIPLETLQHLGENCPFLEELSIQIRRSRGDTHEVLRYKAIGSLPRLKRLFLTLDASDYYLLHGYDADDEDEGREIPETRSDASFNYFDQQYCRSAMFHYYLHPRNGHIRDALINAALDQDLSKSIFQTIRSGRNPCPLAYMEVQVTGAGELSWEVTRDRGFGDVLAKMGRIHRVQRTDHGDIQIESVVDDEFEKHDRYRELRDERGVYPLSDYAVEIYQRIWPRENEHWFDDWHSFPLALSAADEIDWSKDSYPKHHG